MRKVKWMGVLGAMIAVVCAAALCGCGEGVDRRASVNVPALMYHHISEEADLATIVTAETFERHLQLIREAGYTAVSVKEMIAYVQEGARLPDKPVLITFDDGYLSNYEIAYPLLEKYEMKAVVFAIGVSVGKTLYKDTAYEMYPHFSYAQAVEMMESGVMEVQSHTYDMHQWAPYEPEGALVRETAAPVEGESEEAYVEALRADMRRFREEYERETGWALYALAYPQGFYSELTERVAEEEGFLVTFAAAPNRMNALRKGEPLSLFALSRMNVTEEMSEAELLAHLERG